MVHDWPHLDIAPQKADQAFWIDGLPKRAPSPELAYTYFNAMLDRQAMAHLAEASFYAPANSASALSPELREKIDFSPDEQKALNFPDYAYVASNTAAWLEWWNKNVAA